MAASRSPRNATFDAATHPRSPTDPEQCRARDCTRILDHKPPHQAISRSGPVEVVSWEDGRRGQPR